MDPNDTRARELVAAFYERCLTVNEGTDVAAELDRILSGDFVSHGSAESKTKDQLVAQVQGFWKLIPDLAWQVQEMLRDGDRVVVRSVAAGTPSGTFMGVQADRGKSFAVMTIDIHTVTGGQITEVYHLEDWPTAIRQITGS